MRIYPEQKDSSVKWLGNIPSHWDCKKIGALFTERKTKVSDKDYPPLSVAKIGVVPQLATAVKTDAGDNRKLVCAGDFVINSRSDRKGSCGVSELDGSVSLINIVLTPRSKWNRHYVHYLLRNHTFSEEYYRYGRGIVADLWTTRYSEMKNILIPVPPRTEQDQIVRFLDWKVSGINKLINIKKKEIKELEELKKVIINKAVTRGLDENVELKDSGVNWIGMIPVNWDLVKIKRVTKQRNQKGLFEKDNSKYIGLENISGYDSELIDTQSEYDTSVQSMCFKGDVMFSKLRPYLSKVIISPIDAFCTGELLILSDFSGNKEYLRYVMLHQSFIQEITASTYGAKMPRANADFILNQIIPLPKLSEQDKIVEYLNNKIKEIDGMADMIANEVATLHDLKSTLISDVVTGQIDVRDVEIPEYVFEDESSDLSEDDFEAEVTEEED